MRSILAIESSAAVCSVALFRDGKCVELLEETKANSHAEKLAVFCEELISRYDRPDAVAVNGGPGSYTGLRIGVSLAKGLAYGYRIPVIALSGLESMAAWYVVDHIGFDWVIPCVDARRMEVFQAVFDKDGIQKGEAKPLVVGGESWSDLPGRKVLVGDGAPKLKEILGQREDIRIDAPGSPSALHLFPLAALKWEKREFADLAYFEPFYLKEFIALSPKTKPV